MGIRYYHPDLHGYVENIARRRIHVLTNTGGHVTNKWVTLSLFLAFNGYCNVLFWR